MATSTKPEKYRKGRERGAIYTVASGERAFLLNSRLAYIFRAGESTISDAVRKGTACWSVDEETLSNMRLKGIRFIGVVCKENRDVFLTRTEHFFDREKTMIHPKCRTERRYLPLFRFRRRAGRTRI